MTVTADGLKRTNDGKLYVTLGDGGAIADQTFENPTITGAPIGVPKVLLATGIPFYLAPTGTMADNGAFTSGTAFGRTIARLYMYFAADQIESGSAAGWYYAAGSSTTAFTIYNNTYTSGDPTVPSSPTAFATTGPGAITGTTSEISAYVVPIAANALGAYGGVRGHVITSGNNDATAKTARARFSGASGAIYLQNSIASGAAGRHGFEFWNSGATNAQAGGSAAAGYYANSVGATVTGSADTTAATEVHLTLQRGGADDVYGFDGANVEMLRSQ